MTYLQTIEYIHSLGFFSHTAGLERINAVLQLLGNPQDKFQSIHIAGTNGKGSVTVMTAACLSNEGYKTGMFVSPYIIDFRERIQVDNNFIPEEDLVRLSQTVIDTKIELCEFEFITAVAFLYFAQQNVDVAVIETGLGGRLDATNALQSVRVSAITKIGLDHTAVLGDSIEKITAEKCGIIKKGKTVSCPNQKLQALDVIKLYDSNVIIPDLERLQIISEDVLGNTFIYKDVEYQTKLSGAFQIENAVTALEIIDNCGLDVSKEAKRMGLKTAFIPARVEIISNEPLVVLDGAHNPDGAMALRKIIKHFDNATAIVGVMNDKDYEEVLRILLPFCEKVIAVRAAEAPRALSAEILAASAKKYCPNVISAASYDDAISLSKGDNPIFVFGSLYLASGIRDFLKDTYK